MRSRERSVATVAPVGRWAVLAAGLVLAVAGPAGPELGAQEIPDPAPDAYALSLEEALDVARSRNPAFQAVQNDEHVADWELRSAWASLLPSASVSSGIAWQGAGEERFGSITFGEQPSYYFSNYNAGLSLRLDGPTVLAPGQARAFLDATVARVRSEEATLVLNVTRSYLEVLRQRESRRLAELELERARLNLRLARGQQAVGAVSPLDVRQAEVAVGRAEVTVLQAETAHETAHLRLLQAMGADLDQEIRLTTEFDLVEPRWTREGLYGAALRRNPALAQLQANRHASRYGVRIARSAYLPSLNVSAGLTGFTRAASTVAPLVAQARQQAASAVTQCQITNEVFRRLADPLPPQDCSQLQFTDGRRDAIVEQNSRFPFDFTRQPPSLSFSLSLPIFQGLTRQRQLEAARVALDDAEYRLREQELALQADIAAGLAAVRTAYRSALLEERNRELASEQLRLAQERYRLGAATFLDLVEAETVKAQADREGIAAVFAYHDALAQLAALVGTSLQDLEPLDPAPDAPPNGNDDR